MNSLCTRLGNTKLRDVIYQVDNTIRTRLVTRSDTEIPQAGLTQLAPREPVPVHEALAYIDCGPTQIPWTSQLLTAFRLLRHPPPYIPLSQPIEVRK